MQSCVAISAISRSFSAGSESCSIVSRRSAEKFSITNVSSASKYLFWSDSRLGELLNSCRTRFMARIWYSQRKDFDSHRAYTCQCIRTQLKHASFDNLLHEDTLLDCRGPIICSVPLPEDDGSRSTYRKYIILLERYIRRQLKQILYCACYLSLPLDQPNSPLFGRNLVDLFHKSADDPSPPAGFKRDESIQDPLSNPFHALSRYVANTGNTGRCSRG